MRLLLLSALILLSSCGPNFYLKKAERALRKAEQLGAKINQDTVFKTITVTVPERQIDTLLQRVDFRDTITVLQDRILTKIKVNQVDKTVYVNVKCPPDTVRVKVPVIVNRKIQAGHTTWDMVILAIVCLAVGFVISKFVWK